jgi:tRNA-dihydrouridine synthase B
LIGNGDLDSPQKVVEAFRRYGVDGVMIARACLNKTWLFSQAAAAVRGKPVTPDPTPHHYDLVCRRFGVEKGTVLMRKYAVCYAQGRSGARDFRRCVAKVTSPAEFYEAVRVFFPGEDRIATGRVESQP